jgi:hypothetical protein
MRLKACLGAALLIVLLAPAGPAWGRKKAPSPPCSARHSKTLLASEQARISRLTGTNADGEPTTYITGCLYRRNKAFTLSSSSITVGETVAQLRLGGRFVGYWVEGCIKASPCGVEVRVVDLSTGRRTVQASAFSPGMPLFEVTDLELKPNASVAWIAKPDTGGFEVRKSDASGRNQLLDSGPDIDPSSLAVSASIVYWTKAGAPRSAKLD